MAEFINIISKIYDLLTAEERKNFFLLLFIILIAALIDMLGIASVLPFISVLANPKIIISNEFFNNIYQISSIIGVNNEKQFLFMLGIVSFIFLVISLTFRTFTQYYLLRFSLKLEHAISKRIIEGYLHQPYSWFLNKNSADLGKNILSEVSIVIHQSIIPILSFFSQSAVIIAITVLLIIADPIISFSTGLVLGFSYLSLFYFMKKTLSRLGIERLHANFDRFSAVSESFAAIKEIKIKSLENIYINKFSKSSEVYTNNQSLAAVIAHVPRFFFEGIAFGGMIIIILVLLARDSELTNILPIITLYAFAGYRLLPALQHVYAALSQMRFSKSTLDTLYNDLISLNSRLEINSKDYSENCISLQKSIDINRINFRYPNSKQDTIKDLTFSIPVSRKIGIVGTTGSGKTTTVDIILGLLDPIDGSLRVDGKIIDNNNKRSWQKMIGYVPQQIYLSDESVAANIAFGVEKKNINQEAVEQAAKLANLHEFVIKELHNKYDSIIGERGIRLSGGQRQRIGIARALYHKPKVLIFDEATSALDNITEKIVMDAIYNLESSVTLIFITHRMSAVENFDNIILLDKGRLKGQGSFKELNQNNMIFKKMTSKI